MSFLLDVLAGSATEKSDRPHSTFDRFQRSAACNRFLLFIEAQRPVHPENRPEGMN